MTDVRSKYLRDQAAKCRWHADHMTPPEVRDQLLGLAAQYIMQAVEMEKEGRDYGTQN